MTKAAALLEIAGPIMTGLTQLDSVVALVCFGSAATGTADRCSDIELLVFCHPTIISPMMRQQIFERLPNVSGLVLHRSIPGWDIPWAPQTDTLTLGGTHYDISYNTQDWIVHVVQRVITEGATSLPEMPFRPYTLLGLLTNAIPLYDPHQVVQTLVAQAQPYPAVLKAHILDEQVPIMRDGVHELRDYATRGIGNTAFLFQLFRVCDAMSSVLFAINDTYDPATKRLEQALSTLPRVPPQFMLRYTSLLEGPFTSRNRPQIVEQLATLIDDIQVLL